MELQVDGGGRYYGSWSRCWQFGVWELVIGVWVWVWQENVMTRRGHGFWCLRCLRRRLWVRDCWTSIVWGGAVLRNSPWRWKLEVYIGKGWYFCIGDWSVCVCVCVSFLNFQAIDNKWRAQKGKGTTCSTQPLVKNKLC